MININSFKNIYSFTNAVRPLKNYSGYSSTVYNYDNNNCALTPLKADTISFKSRDERLNRALYDAYDNEQACKEVSENAKSAARDLKKTLMGQLGYLIEKDNNGAPITEIMTRIKSPDSIKEKTISEFSYRIANDIKHAFNPNSANDIKKVLSDVIGARIVLGKYDKREYKKIIDGLIELVKTGKLKIKQIENYTPAKNAKNLVYFEEEDIQRLVNAVNEQKNPGEALVEYTQKTKKSGYTALHIDLDLSNDNYIVKNDGYSGEIQIVGQDVEHLKEVEDCCYKLTHGKSIHAGHPAYIAFEKYFNYYYKNEKYINLEENFLEYTARAYAIQRKKNPGSKSKKGYMYPTVKECGMLGKVPIELDFNKLAKIKGLCDSLYAKTQGIEY